MSSIKPDGGGRQTNGCREVAGGLVITRGDRTELFESAGEALDQVPRFVALPGRNTYYNHSGDHFGLLAWIGLLWVIDPTDDLSSLMAPASTKEECHYPAKLISLAEPAGRYAVCHSLEKDGPMRVASNPWSIVGAPKARMLNATFSCRKTLSISVYSANYPSIL